MPGPATDGKGRGWHDMGGRPAGEVNLDEHAYALWEQRVDALLVLSGERGYFTVDALRRALEDMGEEAFESLTYYERWVAAIARNLVETGVLTEAEIADRVAEVEARGANYGEASLRGAAK